MSVIEAGMYDGPNNVNRISLDNKFIKIKVDDRYIDLPSPLYIGQLEQKILGLSADIDKLNAIIAAQSLKLKRLKVFLKKAKFSYE